MGGVGGTGYVNGTTGTDGGGSTDIWTGQPGTEGCSKAGSATDPRLPVAGGGGGVGHTIAGGDAGTGTVPCSPGKPTTVDQSAGQGQGGTCSAGGTGGVNGTGAAADGHRGSAGQGGDGGAVPSVEEPTTNGGGGGGGGYYGGGGGAATLADSPPGSGGGGSSFIKGAPSSASVPGSAVLAAWHGAAGDHATLTATTPTIKPAGHARAGMTLTFTVLPGSTPVPQVLGANTGAGPVGSPVAIGIVVGAITLVALGLSRRRHSSTP